MATKASIQRMSAMRRLRGVGGKRCGKGGAERVGVAAEVEGGDDAAGGGVDGNGEGAEANLILLIADGVAVAADVAEREAEFFHRGDGAGGVGDEVDLGEILLELFGGEIGE